MKCECKQCKCEIDDQKKVEHNGKMYCCEMCAKQCTDEKCVCDQGDCGTCAEKKVS